MKGAYPLQNPRFDSHPLLKLLSEGGGSILDYTALDMMAERVGIRSRAAAAFALPLGGQPPAPALRAGHPLKGAHPLQNPRSHPTLFYGWWMASWLHSLSHGSLVLWRRGWDSNPRTVAGQRFSRPPDSATLAPLRTRQDSSAKPLSRAASIIQIRKKIGLAFGTCIGSFVLKNPGRSAEAEAALAHLP